MRNKQFWNEAPLLRLAICMMAGIVVGDRITVGRWLMLIFGVMVVIALLLWKHEHWQSVVIALCFVVLGWMLMERQRASQVVIWPEGEVSYEVVVVSEPVGYPYHRQWTEAEMLSL